MDFSGLLVLVCSFGSIAAFQSYQNSIPNGATVPNTCTVNAADTWPGVGHEALNGGGVRNPFGAAFGAAGSWTPALCNADSDGDGVSNGAELGDPNCIWTAGGGAPEGDAVSHPGICEPVTSDQCKTSNSWVSVCDAADVTTAGPGESSTSPTSGDNSASTTPNNGGINTPLTSITVATLLMSAVVSLLL